MIKSKFTSCIEAVAAKKYDHWRADKEGRLAIIILCDQFTRNAFRGLAKAFSFDHISLQTSKDILKDYNVWKDYKYAEKIWILMPLMHSENKADQLTCLNAFQTLEQ